MTTFVCKYCNKQLASKSSLNNHLLGATYCIKKRKVEDQTKSSFPCDGCKKDFTLKQTRDLHSLKCLDLIRKQYEETIKTYKERVEDLESKLENIAITSVSRPVTVNQNSNKVQQINNLYAITPTHFEEQSEYLTLEHIKEGVAGYVRFALEFMLKNRILCTDVSRKIVKYKNADDVVVTDAEMTVLAEKIFSAIKVRNETIIDTYLRELNEKLWDANYDGLTEKQIEELEKGLDVVRNMVMRLVNQRIESKEITMGKKPLLHRNFVKGICERSTQASE